MVASLTLVKSAYRLGETVNGSVVINSGDGRVLRVSYFSSTTLPRLLIAIYSFRPGFGSPRDLRAHRNDHRDQVGSSSSPDHSSSPRRAPRDYPRLCSPRLRTRHPLGRYSRLWHFGRQAAVVGSALLPRHSSFARRSSTKRKPLGARSQTRPKPTALLHGQRNRFSNSPRSIQILRLRIRARRPSHAPRSTDDHPHRRCTSHARPRRPRHLKLAHLVPSGARSRLRPRPLLEQCA